MSKRDLSRSLNAHCAALTACTRCGLAAEVRPIISRARTPRVLLVGQAPGRVEQDGGKPFAGRAGKTLFRWLARAGVDEDTARDRIYVSAITRCFPGPSPSGRGDRVPSPAEQEQCAGWLEDELRIIRPRLIIPVGRLAISRFLGPRALDDVIGREHSVAHAGGESLVIPLPHPSGASSWIHQGNHPELLDRALVLIGARLAELHVSTNAARARSVA